MPREGKRNVRVGCAIEKLQADIKKLQDTEHQQRKEFEDFLNAFSAE